jgi:hypothetical protein
MTGIPDCEYTPANTSNITLLSYLSKHRTDPSAQFPKHRPAAIPHLQPDCQLSALWRSIPPHRPAELE